MKKSQHTLLTALMVMTFLTGCQTTGDPNQGGLFEWDEEKAQARQLKLKRDYERRCKALAELQQTNGQKQLEEAQAKHLLALEQVKLANLRQEQKMLSINIKQLESLLVDMNSFTDGLIKMVKAKKPIPSGNIPYPHPLPAIDPTKELIKTMKQRLQQTTREILLLTGH